MKSIRRIVKKALLGAGVIVIGPASDRCRGLIRLMLFAKSRGMNRLAAFCSGWLQSYGVYISHKAQIAEGLRLRHPTALVIGAGVHIGKNVTIFQSVTIGGRRLGDAQKGNYPTIGDGTVIFAGAVIVGKVNVGSNCVVGANSVVTKDVPDNATVVGVPARVVSYCLTEEKEKRVVNE